MPVTASNRHWRFLWSINSEQVFSVFIVSSKWIKKPKTPDQISAILNSASCSRIDCLHNLEETDNKWQNSTRFRIIQLLKIYHKIEVFWFLLQMYDKTNRVSKMSVTFIRLGAHTSFWAIHAGFQFTRTIRRKHTCPKSSLLLFTCSRTMEVLKPQ